MGVGLLGAGGCAPPCKQRREVTQLLLDPVGAGTGLGQAGSHPRCPYPRAEVIWPQCLLISLTRPP